MQKVDVVSFPLRSLDLLWSAAAVAADEVGFLHICRCEKCVGCEEKIVGRSIILCFLLNTVPSCLRIPVLFRVSSSRFCQIDEMTHLVDFDTLHLIVT